MEQYLESLSLEEINDRMNVLKPETDEYKTIFMRLKSIEKLFVRIQHEIDL